jgi:hypothetical protein
MIVLSSISMAAYKCIFHDGFRASPEAYFFHLFYYRSRHCDSAVDWSVFGLDNDMVSEALHMPDEISLVSRTYQLSLVQLIINCLLVACSIAILVATMFHVHIVSRRLTYWIIFVPYCLVFHLAIVFDFVAGTYYGDDRLRSFSVDGTLTMLEVFNRVEARPYIAQIDETFRIVAPNVMFYICVKAIVLPVVSCFLLFFVVFAGWEVVDGNKLRAKKKTDEHS